MRKAGQPRWEPYDPTWLVELARSQDPPQPDLAVSLAECRRAQRRSCCGPRVCGYYFVDLPGPKPPGIGRRVAYDSILLNPRRVNSVGDVVVDVLVDGRVGGVEFL